MLAWVRTVLGLVAAGIAVLHVIPTFSSTGVREFVGIGLILVGRYRRFWAGGDGGEPAQLWPPGARCRVQDRSGALVGLSAVVLVATLLN